MWSWKSEAAAALAAALLGCGHGNAAVGSGGTSSSSAATAASAGAGGSAASFAGATTANAGAGVAGASSAGASAAGSSAAGSSNAGSSDAGAGAMPGPPTFTRVWNEIVLNKGCGSVLCHGGGQGMLMMDTQADAYTNLVNVAAAGPACGTSGKLRVKAGEPDASLMLDKISHVMPACGVTMPVAAKFAPDCASPSPTVCTTPSEIALVHDWILAGAMND